jgi:hypothetical protein
MTIWHKVTGIDGVALSLCKRVKIKKNNHGKNYWN